MDSMALLGSNDFRIVFTKLWPVRHMWHTIGIVLKIDSTTLEVIEMDNRRTDDCFRDMLTTWLKGIEEPFPCWKHLAMALQFIGITVLLGMSLSYLHIVTRLRCDSPLPVETSAVWPPQKCEPSPSLEISSYVS